MDCAQRDVPSKIPSTNRLCQDKCFFVHLCGFFSRCWLKYSSRPFIHQQQWSVKHEVVLQASLHSSWSPSSEYWYIDRIKTRQEFCAGHDFCYKSPLTIVCWAELAQCKVLPWAVAHRFFLIFGPFRQCVPSCSYRSETSGGLVSCSWALSPLFWGATGKSNKETTPFSSFPLNKSCSSKWHRCSRCCCIQRCSRMTKSVPLKDGSQPSRNESAEGLLHSTESSAME